MPLNKRFLITFLVLLFSSGGIAQDNEKQSLQKILKVLEQRYNITFTFIDKNVEGIFILPPAKENDLKETLLYLRQQTELLFQPLRFC